MKNDIGHPDDVKLLIDVFYGKIRDDQQIGYIFNEVAHVDWAHHLPIMYAFWEFLLLGKSGFVGNPMEKHRILHQKHPLKAADFDRWVAIFQESVDELFEGKVAEDAKFRAYSIAETWKPKFSGTGGITLP